MDWCKISVHEGHALRTKEDPRSAKDGVQVPIVILGCSVPLKPPITTLGPTRLWLPSSVPRMSSAHFSMSLRAQIDGSMRSSFLLFAMPGLSTPQPNSRVTDTFDYQPWAIVWTI